VSIPPLQTGNVNERLRIVVTGLAATYPLGGVFWDYLQYPLGLARLGHDVLYLEDTGKWTYDPGSATFVKHGVRNAALLREWLKALDPILGDRWFFRDGGGTTYGLEWNDVVAFCREADLFVHLSGSCCMREEYFQARRVVFVDTDPIYTQALVAPDVRDDVLDPDDRWRVEMVRRHDRFFTFAENVGVPECRVPLEPYGWIPTRQPIVLDKFESASLPVGDRRHVLTTIASWAPSDRDPVVRGVRYGGKRVELERFIDLPSRSALPLELALSGAAPVERLRAHGWRVVNGQQVSRDPWDYQRYLARSLGECSVAKHAYVASRSGWFSCRSACYLALGVPVVVQDTGFERVVPAGRGVLAFSTPDEARDAILQLARDPEGHASAARAIAHEYFGSDVVLRQLIERALG
jgi:hypothetical protein